jgi:hypothetical protein
LRDLLIFVSGFRLRIAAKSGKVSETFLIVEELVESGPARCGFLYCPDFWRAFLAHSITHVRIAVKSSNVSENFLGVSRALASPPILTCRKMRPSVFLPMIAYAYS